MENIIQKHRAFVAGQIEKSFDSNLQSPAQEVEKAYNVGDEKDFNGRTYYVHELNDKGQPKWRLKEKKGNKPSAVDIINKIPEKEFKSITKTLEKVNPDSDDAPKYLEEEAMSDEELANFRACAKHFKNNDRINKTTQEWCKKWEQLAQEEIDFRKEQKQKKSGSKSSDPRDKIAQDIGFKDYEEMRGYQNYVTSKNLLKKKSMQAKTKEDTRKELEANVAKYEREHADVIKRIAEKKGAKSKSAVKIDETTIDQTEYDSQLKMAKQVDDSARSMAKNIIQGNIDKTKKKLQETISSRPGAKATITNLQKDLTKFISQKKAVEDAEKELR